MRFDAGCLLFITFGVTDALAFQIVKCKCTQLPYIIHAL